VYDAFRAKIEVRSAVTAVTLAKYQSLVLSRLSVQENVSVSSALFENFQPNSKPACTVA
jgi:hypothetical protein